MQTGLLIETPEDQSLVVQSSMEDVLFTLPRGTQKIVSLSSAESETSAAASAVMDAILIRTILCWVLQVRILMNCTWTHQLHGEFCHAKGLGV